MFLPIPQLLKNVRYSEGQAPLDSPEVQKVIQLAENRIAGKGRILIRKSGTEPLIRVMAECENDTLLSQVVDDVVGAVQQACTV